MHAGRVGTYEVCDASPYLKNAARFHGEPTDERCPICRRENLTHVHYIYGDELKQSAGQARTLAELPALAMTLREFQVFVVEVCRSCSGTTWSSSTCSAGTGPPLTNTSSAGHGRVRVGPPPRDSRHDGGRGDGDLARSR